MTETMYWGFKLNPESVAKLLSHFPPLHPNVYAEHLTIAYRPSASVEKSLAPMCGEERTVDVIGYAYDEYVQAVVVDGIPRLDPGTPHITISCANGVGPVYSNTLLSKGYETVPTLQLHGRIGRVNTKRIWSFSDDKVDKKSI